MSNNLEFSRLNEGNNTGVQILENVMKKMLTPFLLGLMLVVSSATVLADSSSTQQNNAGGASLSSVLKSYDKQ